MANCSSIAGMTQLWQRTTGIASVCVAIVDGPVRADHECFRRHDLYSAQSGGQTPEGPAIRHGTFIASLLFANHASPLPGLIPSCRALPIPVFRDYSPTQLSHCSQLQLASAIQAALCGGAQIINVSAGQFVTDERQLEPQLGDVLETCRRRGVLVVSAAGNDGCRCHRIPAYFPTVLAVGAHDALGNALHMSNWGSRYSGHGLLAPGENLMGALAGGGYCTESGTSIATAVVSGICALLLSACYQQHRRILAAEIGEIVRATATPCRTADGERCLHGRLNVTDALATLLKGTAVVSQVNLELEPQTTKPPADEATLSNLSATVNELSASTASLMAPRLLVPQLLEPLCGCSASAEKPACSCASAKPPVKMLREVYTGAPALQKAFALGRIAFDFPDDARRDAVAQRLPVPLGDHKQLAAFLRSNPQRAEGFLWTVEVEENIPICALQPQGPLAREQYVRILEFFDEQENGDANHEYKKADRAAIPGFIVGEVFAVNSARVLPLIAPDLEGMQNMNLDALLEVARLSLQPEEPLAKATKEDRLEFQKTVQELDARFATVRASSVETLTLLQDESTGLAVQSGDRARAFVTIDFGPVLSQMYGASLQGKSLELSASGASRDTPTGRDYQDVTLSFFNPANTDEANTNVTFVIDVTDVKPRFVAVRPIRRTRGPQVAKLF